MKTSILWVCVVIMGNAFAADLKPERGEYYCAIGEKNHLVCSDKSFLGYGKAIITNSFRVWDNEINSATPKVITTIFKKTKPNLYAIKGKYFCRLGLVPGTLKKAKFQCGPLEKIKMEITQVKLDSIAVKNEEEKKTEKEVVYHTPLNQDSSSELLTMALRKVDADLQMVDAITKFFKDKNLNKCRYDLYRDFAWFYDPLAPDLFEKFDVSSYPCFVYAEEGPSPRYNGVVGYPPDNARDNYILPVLNDMKAKLKGYLAQKESSQEPSPDSFEETKPTELEKDINIYNSGYIAMPISIEKVAKTFFLESSLCILSNSSKVFCINEDENEFSLAHTFVSGKESINFSITPLGFCGIKFKRTTTEISKIAKLETGSEELNSDFSRWKFAATEGDTAFPTQNVGTVECLTEPASKKITLREVTIGGGPLWESIMKKQLDGLSVPENYRSRIEEDLDKQMSSYTKGQSKLVEGALRGKVKIVDLIFDKGCFQVKIDYDSDFLMTSMVAEKKYITKTRVMELQKAFKSCKNKMSDNKLVLEKELYYPENEEITKTKRKIADFDHHHNYKLKMDEGWYQYISMLAVSGGKSGVYKYLYQNKIAKKLPSNPNAEYNLIFNPDANVSFLNGYYSKKYTSTSSRKNPFTVDTFEGANGKFKNGSQQISYCSLGNFSAEKDLDKLSCCFGLKKNLYSEACVQKKVELAQALIEVAEAEQELPVEKEAVDGVKVEQGGLAVNKNPFVDSYTAFVMNLAHRCLSIDTSFTEVCRENSHIVSLGISLQLLKYKLQAQEMIILSQVKALESSVTATVQAETIAQAAKAREYKIQDRRKRTNLWYKTLSGKTVAGIPLDERPPSSTPSDAIFPQSDEAFIDAIASTVDDAPKNEIATEANIPVTLLPIDARKIETPAGITAIVAAGIRNVNILEGLE